MQHFDAPFHRPLPVEIKQSYFLDLGKITVDDFVIRGKNLDPKAIAIAQMSDEGREMLAYLQSFENVEIKTDKIVAYRDAMTMQTIVLLIFVVECSESIRSMMRLKFDYWMQENKTTHHVRET